MIYFILFVCIVAAIFLYCFILRPLFRFLFVPLTSRIPNGREYMPNLRARP